GRLYHDLRGSLRGYRQGFWLYCSGFCMTTVFSLASICNQYQDNPNLIQQDSRCSHKQLVERIGSRRQNGSHYKTNQYDIALRRHHLAWFKRVNPIDEKYEQRELEHDCETS